jgi:hypothetical protein
LAAAFRRRHEENPHHQPETDHMTDQNMKAAKMIADAAATIADATSPAGAGRVLRNVADQIEGKATERRPSAPATAREAGAIGRTAIDYTIAEFAKTANECIAAIDAGRTPEARAVLAYAAQKLTPASRSNH